jgi:hypothetical protein
MLFTLPERNAPKTGHSCVWVRQLTQRWLDERICALICAALVLRCLLIMPTTPELIELRDVLLRHALGPKAGRQHCALNHVFSRHIADGEQCKPIPVEEILVRCPSKEGKEAEIPKDAVHRLMADIGLKLGAFYGEDGSGKLPHPESHRVKYRVQFKERGNYALEFPPYRPRKLEADLVPIFWKPHLPPYGTAKILFPEPIFLIDEKQTYFRNSAMKTEPKASALDYLKIPGSLKSGYSYVPSGIVQAMLVLTKALRGCDNRWPEVPTCEALKPGVSSAPADQDLILLATPTSTDLVATLQDDQKMVVDAEGVHREGAAPQNDTPKMQWGVLTRKRHNHRIVTILAAKHGRSVEAMARFLVLHEQLVLLAQRMGRLNVFPETFQVLFRMPVAVTREGPSVSDALISDIHVPEDQAEEEETL